MLLLFIVLYLYGILGMILFYYNDPWHFGTLTRALVSLFRASTLEDWTDIMYINYFKCDGKEYDSGIYNTLMDEWNNTRSGVSWPDGCPVMCHSNEEYLEVPTLPYGVKYDVLDPRDGKSRPKVAKFAKNGMTMNKSKRPHPCKRYLCIRRDAIDCTQTSRTNTTTKQSSAKTQAFLIVRIDTESDNHKVLLAKLNLLSTPKYVITMKFNVLNNAVQNTMKSQ